MNPVLAVSNPDYEEQAQSGGIMVVFDKELCTGCGACIKDCPGKAIKLAEDKAQSCRPCIQCGHCVAICPVNAVSIPEYEMDEVEEYVEADFKVCPDHYLHALKFRRSIRDFKEQKIERDKLDRILDAGRYTATAKNMQACTFVLVQEQMEEFRELLRNEIPGVLEILKESAPDYERAFRSFYKKWQRNPKDDTFLFNAPAFLVIASQNPLDGGLAAANIENMAVAEGAGALYSGYMMRVLGTSPALQEWLGIGEKKVSCCMLLGYPNVKYRRTAPRRKADVIWR